MSCYLCVGSIVLQSASCNQLIYVGSCVVHKFKDILLIKIMLDFNKNYRNSYIILLLS